MKLNELVNLKIDPAGPRSLRQNARRWLAGFFALMLACTVISRAADSLTVAVVEAASPDRSTLTHRFTADGRLSAIGESAVSALAGVPVKSVETRRGAAVKAGDPLFTLDPDSLKTRLYEQQLELKKLRLLLEKAKTDLIAGGERTELTLQRAQEDYDFAVSRNRNKLLQAGEDRRYARQELKDYIYDHNIDESAEDAKQDAGYMQLKNSYHKAQLLYEDLEANQSEEMAKAERAIEDALVESPDVSAETLQIDCQIKELTIAQTQKALAADGVVTAPGDGVVTDVLLAAGKLTTAEAGVLLADTKGGLRFSAEITTEQSRFVSVGDELEVALAGGGSALIKARVESVAAIADKSGYFEMTASIPAGKGSLGMSAVGEISRKTQSYPICVPLSAIRSDGAKKYLLVVRETQTVLGTEQLAERVDVLISDQSDSKAAVTGALSPDDKVITASSKAIGTGDRVRLQSR